MLEIVGMIAHGFLMGALVSIVIVAIYGVFIVKTERAKRMTRGDI